MSSPKRGDAAFRYQVSGAQEYWHHLGHPLHRFSAVHPEQVFEHSSADLSTVRRVRIASTVEDLRGVLRWDGAGDSLARFLKEARAGATLEYFPSLSNPSESYTCILVSAADIAPDPDFWWEYRYGVEVHLRRIDGGSWAGLLDDLLFYYKAGNDRPGLTFTRSGAVGPYVDSDGVIQAAAANIFRTTWIDDAPYLLLEQAKTNLVTSDDLTAWSATGTPVVTGSVDDPAGGTGAYTVEDNDGAIGEAIYRTVTFTGDGTKSMAFVVRENTMPAAGNQLLYLRDETAAANRLELDITSWVNGEPQVTGTVGTHLGNVYIGNGYWAVFGQTTTVTAANTNSARLLPARNAAETGSYDVYRVNAFDSVAPSFSILDASETRNVDRWYAEFPHKPQAMTVYVKFVEGGSLVTSSGSSAGVVHIGASVGATDPRFLLYATNATGYAVAHDNGSATAAATYSAATPEIGDTVELRGVLNADGSVTIGQSINSGAEGTASDATAVTLDDDWADTRLYLNVLGGGNDGLAAFAEVKLVAGVKTMAEMRAL